MIVCICGLIHVLILPISLQSIVLLEHRIYWYTYKDRYIQFMTRIMTVLHLTCLWWRDSDEVELQSKHSLQRGLTLSELHQGFTILGHQQLAGGWTFHSSNQYIQWKINCSNAVQTVEGPFSFLTHVAGKGVIALLVHLPSQNNTSLSSCSLWIETTELWISPPTHINLLQIQYCPNYFRNMKIKASLTGALI